MSIPELFHHETRFVGCLAISRFKRKAAGEMLVTPSASEVVSSEDAAQWKEIADTTLFGTDNAGRGEQISLVTTAMDYESIGHCPVLGDDGRCTIHNDRKPAVCSMVPFEAHYPDGLQGVVLINRKLDENCIVGGFQEGFPVVVRSRKIESMEYLQALNSRRNELRLEKYWWGNAVCSMLRRDLFDNPGQLARISVDGLFSLSIVPVLVVLAGYTDRCSERCLQYIDRQTELIDHKIDQAITRKSALDKPITREFQKFKQAYASLRPELEKKSFRLLPRYDDRHGELEKYLGI